MIDFNTPDYLGESFELENFIILIVGKHKNNVKCFDDIKKPNDSAVLLDKNRNQITINIPLVDYLRELDCPIYLIDIDYWADNYDDYYDYYEGRKEEFEFESFLNDMKDMKLISFEELFCYPEEHLDDYEADDWHEDYSPVIILNKANCYGKDKDYEIAGRRLFKGQPMFFEYDDED
jgi:hypothetical protein